MHIYVFWYVPIHGNMTLFGEARCNMEKNNEGYHCKNFWMNPHLRILYVLFVIYLTFSSLQLRYGFPTIKIPSSVLKTHTDLGKIGADIFYAVPFAVELRCIIDFTMTKTSLDVFQFFQLYVYHYYIYGAG